MCEGHTLTLLGTHNTQYYCISTAEMDNSLDADAAERALNFFSIVERLKVFLFDDLCKFNTNMPYCMLF